MHEQLIGAFSARFRRPSTFTQTETGATIFGGTWEDGLHWYAGSFDIYMIWAPPHVDVLARDHVLRDDLEKQRAGASFHDGMVPTDQKFERLVAEHYPNAFNLMRDERVLDAEDVLEDVRSILADMQQASEAPERAFGSASTRRSARSIA